MKSHITADSKLVKEVGGSTTREKDLWLEIIQIQDANLSSTTSYVT